MNIATLNKQHKIAKRYALALYKLRDNELLDNLNEAHLAFVQNPELLDFMANKIVSADDKKQVIYQVFKDFSLNTYNFFMELIDAKKFNYFCAIVYELNSILDEKRNILRAEVVSIIELDDVQKAILKSKLENKFAKTFELEYHLDSSIISGLLIKIGDTIIDLTVKAKLKHLKKQLI